jgi:hypothetical protein
MCIGVLTCRKGLKILKGGNQNPYIEEDQTTPFVLGTLSPLMEQELSTLQEHLSSPPVLSEVRVARFLVLYVYFVDHS